MDRRSSGPRSQQGQVCYVIERKDRMGTHPLFHPAAHAGLGIPPDALLLTRDHAQEVLSLLIEPNLIGKKCGSLLTRSVKRQDNDN